MSQNLYSIVIFHVIKLNLYNVKKSDLNMFDNNIVLVARVVIVINMLGS